MSGATFVPEHAWQPTGQSRVDALKASGKTRAFYNSLSDAEKRGLKYKWDFWARPAQLMPPGNAVPHKLGWKYWIILAGRGFGKTRTAAEAVRKMVETRKTRRFALVGPTYRDVEQTMIKGESGLLSVFPQSSTIVPRYVKNDNAVYFSHNGKLVSTGQIYTGEKPDQQRGPEFDFAWFDELGAFKYLDDVWKLFVGTHRLGPNPRAIFTTTPRATLLHIEGLLDHPRAITTIGTSQENRDNLAPDTIETLENIYKDTDFAAQELGGVLRMEDLGAIFKIDWLHKHRAHSATMKRSSSQTIIGDVPINKFAVVVDPSGSSKTNACECGIVVAGLGADGNAYVVADLSKRATPDEWSRIAVQAALEWNAASIVYEKNFGDEMVATVIRGTAKDMNVKMNVVPVEAISDKVQRALLVSPLVQKGRVRLVGYLGQLEKQLTTWLPGSSTSPDRLDAFVWAATYLLLKQSQRGIVV